MLRIYGSRDVPALVENLVARLKRRQVVGSWNVSTETLIVLRQVISVSKWNNVKALIADISQIGQRLIAAQPQELAVGNIIRRVLHMIREEYKVYVKDFEEDEEDKQLSAVDRLSLNEDSKNNSVPFKPTIIQGIAEMLDEQENMYVNVSSQALEHIHSNEIIMTCGKSHTVEEFFKTASRKRQFQVIVVESTKKSEAFNLAKKLSNAGITTTIIPHSAVFAVMSRVNKVILGTHAILANGGLVSASGSQTIAAAAKHHATPIVVCAGLYKLSPLFPTDIERLNICVSPTAVLNYAEGPLIDVETVCPYYDYIEPELVGLFITNNGGHPPSYLYRLITENYDPEDNDLENSILLGN
ncbi:translation initiation factor eIF-2B beta subunit [Neoconidiobolus thromboides FSU 785]|nr:translation initiation factor eIF-2B beta subunit [Neoconidiobolus thromboides FSU 785]